MIVGKQIVLKTSRNGKDLKTHLETKKKSVYLTIDPGHLIFIFEKSINSLDIN